MVFKSSGVRSAGFFRSACLILGSTGALILQRCAPAPPHLAGGCRGAAAVTPGLLPGLRRPPDPREAHPETFPAPGPGRGANRGRPRRERARARCQPPVWLLTRRAALGAPRVQRRRRRSGRAAAPGALPGRPALLPIAASAPCANLLPERDSRPRGSALRPAQSNAGGRAVRGTAPEGPDGNAKAGYEPATPLNTPGAAAPARTPRPGHPARIPRYEEGHSSPLLLLSDLKGSIQGLSPP